MKFRTGVYLIVIGFLSAVTAVPSIALGQTGNGVVPGDAVTPSPEQLFRVFANHTEEWGNGAGIFWDGDGTWRAVDTDDQFLGVGEWYVTTASRICYDVRWYWRQDFGTESRSESVCSRFRIDSDGQMWSTTGSLAGPWLPFNEENLVRGNTIARGFNEVAGILNLRE